MREIEILGETCRFSLVSLTKDDALSGFSFNFLGENVPVKQLVKEPWVTVTLEILLGSYQHTLEFYGAFTKDITREEKWDKIVREILSIPGGREGSPSMLRSYRFSDGVETLLKSVNTSVFRNDGMSTLPLVNAPVKPQLNENTELPSVPKAKWWKKKIKDQQGKDVIYVGGVEIGIPAKKKCPFCGIIFETTGSGALCFECQTKFEIGKVAKKTKKKRKKKPKQVAPKQMGIPKRRITI